MKNYNGDVYLKGVKISDNVDVRSDRESALYVYINSNCENCTYYISAANELCNDEGIKTRYRSVLIKGIKTLSEANAEYEKIIEILGYKDVGFDNATLSLKKAEEASTKNLELLDTLAEIEESINEFDNDDE